MDLRLKVSKHSERILGGNFRNPSEIGYFSVDCNRQLHFDRSQMKYYVPKSRREFPIDLNADYGQAVEGDYDPAERLRHVLKWIQNQNPRIDVDFITLRGTLKRVLCTPYSNVDWSICATKFKGIIYFREVLTEDKIFREENMTEEEKQMCAWGYKFEQYMVSDIPKGTPDVSSNTHQLEEFSTMIRNTLGSHSVLFKAELDCVDSEFSVDGDCTEKYIELKTSKIMSLPQHFTSFRKYKTLQWWAQCHLAGVKKVVCGMRDNDGKVHFVEEYKTSKLPAICQNFWDPNVCHTFCNKFLNFLKDTVTEDNYRIVYKLDYRGEDFVTCKRIRNPDPEYKVIPGWFARD